MVHIPSDGTFSYIIRNLTNSHVHYYSVLIWICWVIRKANLPTK